MQKSRPPSIASLSLWLGKGPRRIIAEFDEQMKTETYRAAEKL
jgi:hypothetical protein